MPYVTQEQRDEYADKVPTVRADETPFSLAEAIDEWFEHAPPGWVMEKPGVAVWGVSVLFNDYRRTHGDSFQTYYEIFLGAAQFQGYHDGRSTVRSTIVELAQQEFYRVVVAPYEEKKAAANGEVFV